MEGAKEAIIAVDKTRLLQNMSQAELSGRAGFNDGGQQYRRMYAAMDCKVSTLLKYLHAQGRDLKIVEGTDEKQSI